MKRIEWLDYAKGIGIILVIYGHTYVPDLFNVWLCSFHMPLFFILSGFTFPSYQRYDSKDFLLKKVKSLVIPYVVFVSCLVLWKLIQIIIFGGSIGSVIKAIIGIFIQIRTTSYGPGAWFLPTLFIAEIIVYHIINIFHNKDKLLLVSSIILLFSGYVYCEYIDIKLPWGIDASVVASSFIILGYLVKKNFWFYIHNSKSFKICGLFFIIPNIFFAFFNYRIMDRTVGMWSNNYGNLIYFVLSAISGTVFIIWFCMKIKSINFILEIGQHSLVYYGIHVIFVELFRIIVSKIPNINVWIENTEIGKFIFGTISVIITLAIVKNIYPFFERIIAVINGRINRVLSMSNEK